MAAVIIGIEIVLVVALAYGYVHEQKIIEFEDRVALSIRRWWRKYNPCRVIRVFALAISEEIIEKCHYSVIVFKN